jgi:hypothetical protein
MSRIKEALGKVFALWFNQSYGSIAEIGAAFSMALPNNTSTELASPVSADDDSAQSANP